MLSLLGSRKKKRVSTPSPAKNSIINANTGRLLRIVRKANGYSLQQVQDKTNGMFKASVLGAYERGERAISFEKLYILLAFYDYPIDRFVTSVQSSFYEEYQSD